jgi:hypothetical protein
MTKRNELERRPRGGTFPARFTAALADLSERWDEQNRALYWVFKDLGGEPERILVDSPFEAFVATARTSSTAWRPVGGLGV